MLPFAQSFLISLVQKRYIVTIVPNQQALVVRSLLELYLFLKVTTLSILNELTYYHVMC